MAGIFKAYDIRGTVPEQLDANLAEHIGNAFASFLGAERLVVGRDMRTHSPDIQAGVIRGIQRAGCDVIDIGLASTPMAYYAIGSLECDGGLNVTASHNPPQYNGFKLCREKAIPLSEVTGIADIEKLVESGQWTDAEKKGGLSQESVLDRYVEHVLGFVSDLEPMKVVIDTANGMGGLAVPRIAEKLKLDVVPLYFDLDGRFPNHEANPIQEENLVELKKQVRATGAALGVSFDGDADRVGFVDENGETVPCDLVTALIAKERLKSAPGAAVVYDLRSSWAVPEAIKEAGGRPVRDRVGHSFMKATLRKENGISGGELSGHYYFREHFFADSAAIAMVTVLGLISSSGKTLSELVQPLRRYHATGEINFEVEDKAGMMKSLAERYHDGEVDHLDGVTVQYADWWFNVRPSNTEPLLRLNLEARDADTLAKKRDELVGLIGRTV
ncbi:MAG: phosphomannomutase/phosphoglucomutase [Planctomycetota bacterium]